MVSNEKSRRKKRKKKRVGRRIKKVSRKYCQYKKDMQNFNKKEKQKIFKSEFLPY
jgi:hypothetical protein